ncbi:MAG: hypothetical protein EOP54_19340 [Sphingobacteriales bacterium]|nr:MAG: hypothetical protein EOP54_19340 [Sphingobacteriales bacterium]
MDELVLPVTCNGTNMELPLKMYAYGYTFRIEVLIGEESVIFEPDEEGSYRALSVNVQFEKGKLLDLSLLKAVVTALEKLNG